MIYLFALIVLGQLAMLAGFTHDARHACPRTHELAARFLLPLAIAYDVHIRPAVIA